MALSSKFWFSLLTLFLVMVIAALCASHVSMMRRMAEADAKVAAAQAEIADVRKQFGYIKVTDPNLIYISKIESGESSAMRYRMIMPRGCFYMLHITDMQDFPPGGPKNPQPTKTITMNYSREGGDFILEWDLPRDPDRTPRLVVKTDSSELFSCRIEGWKTVAYPNSGWHLTTEEKWTFSPDETIRYFFRTNDRTKRGYMLWMEPASNWYKRRGEKLPTGS
jgi:hypothetical protein